MKKKLPPTEFVAPKIASQMIGVHAQTLRRWAEDGKISFTRTAGGKFRYDVAGYLKQREIQDAEDMKRRVEARKAKETVKKTAKGPKLDVLALAREAGIKIRHAQQPDTIAAA